MPNLLEEKRSEWILDGHTEKLRLNSNRITLLEQSRVP